MCSEGFFIHNINLYPRRYPFIPLGTLGKVGTWCSQNCSSWPCAICLQLKTALQQGCLLCERHTGLIPTFSKNFLGCFTYRNPSTWNLQLCHIQWTCWSIYGEASCSTCRNQLDLMCQPCGASQWHHEQQYWLTSMFNTILIPCSDSSCIQEDELSGSWIVRYWKKKKIIHVIMLKLLAHASTNKVPKALTER